MPTFLIRSATSRSSSYPIVLTSLSGLHPRRTRDLKFRKFRESNQQILISNQTCCSLGQWCGSDCLIYKLKIQVFSPFTCLNVTYIVYNMTGEGKSSDTNIWTALLVTLRLRQCVADSGDAISCNGHFWMPLMTSLLTAYRACCWDLPWVCRCSLCCGCLLVHPEWLKLFTRFALVFCTVIVELS